MKFQQCGSAPPLSTQESFDWLERTPLPRNTATTSCHRFTTLARSSNFKLSAPPRSPPQTIQLKKQPLPTSNISPPLRLVSLVNMCIVFTCGEQECTKPVSGYEGLQVQCHHCVRFPIPLTLPPGDVLTECRVTGQQQ